MRRAGCAGAAGEDALSGTGSETAPVVVIGAGCIGASVAYHLGRRGVRGVVVLEKEPFAGAGSTSKAAGGVRAQFSTPVNVQISMRSIAHLERFREEMETDPVFFQVGYLFVLCDADGWTSFQRQVEMQRGLGLPVRTLTPDEVRNLVPVLNVSDVLGGTFCPKDGLVNPHEITQAYVAQARRLGARFEFGRAARGLLLDRGRVTGVVTEAGPIATPSATS